jgi:hypothetical protein
MEFELKKDIHKKGNNLLAFFDEVKKIVLNSNNHEKLIEKNLLKYGFTETKNKMKCKDRESIINKIDDKNIMPNNTFIKQPYGCQQSPDFLLKYNNFIIGLECKSSKTNYPLYNSGGIHEYIYVFSKQNGETIFYQGNDIVNDEMIKLTQEYIKNVDKLTKEVNKKLKLADKININYSHYHRDMINTSVNYFTHPLKKIWEKNVYEKMIKIGTL